MSDYFLADDLSGALDAAAAFHHLGRRRVRIFLAPEDWTGGEGDDVIALTTETRNASPERAAAEVARAIAHGTARGGRLIYKKIDSTLRGQVAAEMAALAAALPGARILFAPANPKVGRTVGDGVLLVHGVPVAETEFARDPMSPVRESVIRRLLGAVASERVMIPDTAGEDDLAAAVTRMDAAGGAWVGVGSGALARPVAARRARGSVAARSPGGAAKIPAGPALMICGSAHPGNRAQADLLARERQVVPHVVRASDPAAAARAARVNLSHGRGAALLLETERGESAQVLRALTEAATRVLAATGVARVFATGGETAFALCQALGVRALEFGAEIEPGLSVSYASRREGPFALAVKPGGFGDARTWVRAWDALAVT